MLRTTIFCNLDERHSKYFFLFPAIKCNGCFFSFAVAFRACFFFFALINKLHGSVWVCHWRDWWWHPLEGFFLPHASALVQVNSSLLVWRLRLKRSRWPSAPRSGWMSSEKWRSGFGPLEGAIVSESWVFWRGPLDRNRALNELQRLDGSSPQCFRAQSAL